MLAHLPTLHPSIPLLLKGPTGAQPFFQRARAAGIPLTEDSADGLAAGFDQWLRREVRELASPLGREFFGSGIQVEVASHFNGGAKDTYPYLDIHDNLANAPVQFTGSDPIAYEAARSGDFGIIVIRVDIENLHRGQPRQRILSRKVLAIDKKQPGAGEAICNYLAHHIPCYTPMQAYNTALNFDRYGEGGTDEERIRNGVRRYIDEEGPSDEDAAALRGMPLPEQMSYLSEHAGMVFKVDFDCPEYALDYKKPDPAKLPPSLRKHAISAGAPVSDDAAFFNYMRDDLATVLLLRWADMVNDPTIRMFEDEINSEMESGEAHCDIAAIWVFGHQTPSQFHHAAQRCAAWLRHLYRFAPFIDAVTEPSK